MLGSGADRLWVEKNPGLKPKSDESLFVGLKALRLIPKSKAKWGSLPLTSSGSDDDENHSKRRFLCSAAEGQATTTATARATATATADSSTALRNDNKGTTTTPTVDGWKFWRRSLMVVMKAMPKLPPQLRKKLVSEEAVLFCAGLSCEQVMTDCSRTGFWLGGGSGLWMGREIKYQL